MLRDPEAPDARLTRTLLRVGLAGVLLWLAAQLIEVLLLIFAGLLITVLLRAPADWLGKRTPLSPGAALALFLVILVASVGGAIWAIAPTVSQQFEDMITELPAVTKELMGTLEQYTWGQWLIDQARSADQILAQPRMMQGVNNALSTSFGALTSVFVVVVVGVWMAIQPQLYLDGALRLVPPRSRPHARSVAGECGEVLQRWLLGKMVSMAVIGVTTGIGLWALGVPLALVLALLAAALTFIPNFGPILAAIPAILLGLSTGPSTALWIVGLYAGVQILDNLLVTPLVQQKAVSMPPALALVAQTALGVLVGALGVVVAVPLTAAAIVVVRRTYVERIESDAAPDGLLIKAPAGAS